MNKGEGELISSRYLAAIKRLRENRDPSRTHSLKKSVEFWLVGMRALMFSQNPANNQFANALAEWRALWSCPP